MKQSLKDAMITLAIIVGITILSFLMDFADIQVENIFMLYIFGILLIIIKTKKYTFGTISSLIMVVLSNYFFVSPRFTFRIADKNYVVSFVIFLVVSMIVTSLNVRIQNQMKELEKTQKFTSALYQFSRGYLDISGVRQVALYGIECLKTVVPRDYVICVTDPKKPEPLIYPERSVGPGEQAIKCFIQRGTECGSKQDASSVNDYRMMPIISKGRSYGVLAVENRREPLNGGEVQMIGAIVPIIAMAMDREFAKAAEQESQLASEREKLRSSLLRSISHDLRTPLAGITGSASFLLESYDQVDAGSRNMLLKDIVDDSIWLGQLVENLLNTTKIQEGQMRLHYADEVVDDLVSEMNQRIQKRLDGRRFSIELPEECQAVPMDGPLIMSVLINLMENAIKHTAENGAIRLRVEKVKEDGKAYMRLAVIDDGTGIAPDIIGRMFDSFVTDGNNGRLESRCGMGLGLSIANEIIKAHNGKMGSYNNEDKGATVYFLLPMERKDIKQNG